MNDGPEWFEAKHHGYGSGLPIRWQGWVLLGGLVLSLLVASFVLLPDHLLGFLVVTAAISGLFALIAAKTTRGGWRWRWGEKD